MLQMIESWLTSRRRKGDQAASKKTVRPPTVAIASSDPLFMGEGHKSGVTLTSEYNMKIKWVVCSCRREGLVTET